MKAKDIATQLGGLVNTTNRMSGNYDTSGIDAEIPEELADPDPIFDIDHDIILTQSEAKAVRSVQLIVNTIVPTIYQGNPVIKDKILQDASQLGQLYYQQKMNNVMIKAIMDTIARGSIESRMFDTYTKLMSIAKDFNKQINEMQNQFRKYYIDTYMDLQHKEDEDLILEDGTNKQKSLNSEVKVKTLSSPNPEGNLELRETSTKDTVLKIQEWKKDFYKNKQQEQGNI